MPKRTDLTSILIIGAGPIVIGQACEFDYSGVQACKALREEGYRVILVNSNPATIMTDPDLADATYVEPITPEVIELIIAKERPDAVLPTMGGQTALNCALTLEKNGVFTKYHVEMIGAKADVIEKAEDRLKFRDAMDTIGLESPKSKMAHTLDEAMSALPYVGLPAIIRPSFTLGGTGGGIAYNVDEFKQICASGIAASPIGEILVEESVLGWKEYEMEVVRDRADNCIIICSIENIDPMGVHTGDSITVAPALTLTDKEYQRMRDASIAVLREIGVETGGSNVQFAVNPADGRMIVIEMNPRVSRSSALASKATGFPIARIATKLAIGYTLDEIANDITGGATPASFEPTIDYVVTKIPRFAFEKYKGSDTTLTTSMKSVGEAMAIGRTFQESFQKALRSLETGLDGFDPFLEFGSSRDALHKALTIPTATRILVVGQALRMGMGVEEIHAASKIDPWFLDQFADLIATEKKLESIGLPNTRDDWRHVKAQGFSDRRLGKIAGKTELEVRALRRNAGVRPAFKRIDTCAGEFASPTPYMYSTYEENCEAEPSSAKKIIILGGGPNRIGQGIEFDYCCCHAAFACAELGIESIMVNCNPETVSTDYDTSDRLYFEPLTSEDVLEIIETENQNGTLLGVIVQFGGQTPLKLAQPLAQAGVAILGTSVDAIDMAEDRERFKALLNKLSMLQPRNAIARTEAEAILGAQAVGYPVVLRPSYVLGGRGMEIVYDQPSLERYVREAVIVSGDNPVLIDQYLRDAIEVDVDALCDGTDVFVAGIMEHIEEAGIHSGDSACALPPYSLSEVMIAKIEAQTIAMAKGLGVIGLINIQYAIKDDTIYVLEANPRASRTAPFVAKAVGIPVALIAAKLQAGMALSVFGLKHKKLKHVAVKEAVFPFARFAGVDPILGPEMRSTGECMGIDSDFGHAFLKSQLGAGMKLPMGGTAFLSVKNSHKPALADLGREFVRLGFKLVATEGSAQILREAGVPVERVNKVMEGRPHIVDAMINGSIQLVVNTTEGAQSLADSYSIRRTALVSNISYYTTIAGARAAATAIAAAGGQTMQVKSLQAYA
ncbi:carbamoyl-phosphate synthase large subunit [Candidatus Phycosocius spiralis]|uniref:Carbamoyl phosphate synthase large chain n=1 Tax=Candidatus Phycosocius spiralis TaxID=2815099 RepID=A0ABQ4PYB3_9PROT|nr:carbamoyl-phosphate synthase large subunit [Candidatus Phycosocius spiralis]GIU68066.1 carbamoyl-phosphate synthase large chain [Candidatus Phycosocius spiralis]